MSRAKNTERRAYVLREGYYEERCVLVYALTSREARKSYSLIDNATYISVGVERAPSLDQYASRGGPSVSDLLTHHAWWFECYACTKHVDGETEGRIVACEDRWSPVVYCNETCRAKRPYTARETEVSR